ncbi:MAG: hypothetical protein PHV37_01860 [Candidatus Gastranaerophilales bacterium]|nr:hypothetical protein [Candidatus Gastranaerophilales bacterium]
MSNKSIFEIINAKRQPIIEKFKGKTLKIFCCHNYKEVAFYHNPEYNIVVEFFECLKCKNRKVTFNNKRYLRESYLSKISMWLNHLYELEEFDVTSILPVGKKDVLHLERCLLKELKTK